MKKFTLTLVVLLVLVLTTSLALASGATATITCDKGQTQNKAFTVTIKYKSDDISRATANLEYNTSELEYISGGNSKGNSGIVNIKGVSDNGKTIVSKVKFKGIKKGKATLKLITKEAYNMSEEQIDVTNKSKEVSIVEGKVVSEKESVKEKPAKEEIITDDVKEEPLQKNVERPIYLYAGIIIGAIILLILIIGISRYARRKK